LGEINRTKGDKNIMKNTIIKRQNNQKTEMLERLKETPVVEVACRKVGIGRATYYRWKLNDEKFSKEADIALNEGLALINDMAESQLLSAIKDQNMTAIIFWLKSHHPSYSAKIEVTGSLKTTETPLTQEQEEILEKAIELASFGHNVEVKQIENI
jgi:ACT domain-containing protein